MLKMYVDRLDPSSGIDTVALIAKQVGDDATRIVIYHEFQADPHLSRPAFAKAFAIVLCILRLQSQRTQSDNPRRRPLVRFEP